MILFAVAYLGGVLTIVSPCILPVLPFVFARSEQPFVRSGLPMLAGMALTFAAVASLAAVGGGWVVQANEYGRIAAVTLLALFGFTLLFSGLSDRLTRPVVAFGARLSETANRRAERSHSFVLPSLRLGIATGLLWAPCAGPILGLLLTGAALHGASIQTSPLLAAYAAGAATSLALALVIGGRVFAAMKRSLGIGEWVRRGLGVGVLAGVAVIALGLDTSFLTRMSLASTTPLEQRLVDRLHPAAETQSHPVTAQGSSTISGNPIAAEPIEPRTAADDLPIEGKLPSLTGAVAWLNSPPLTTADLKGKVVLIDFWTCSCINCLRAIPYVRAWAGKYKDQGLVVIGVHSPEFAFEKNIEIRHRDAAEPVACEHHDAGRQLLFHQRERMSDISGREQIGTLAFLDPLAQYPRGPEIGRHADPGGLLILTADLAQNFAQTARGEHMQLFGPRCTNHREQPERRSEQGAEWHRQSVLCIAQRRVF